MTVLLCVQPADLLAGGDNLGWQRGRRPVAHRDDSRSEHEFRDARGDASGVRRASFEEVGQSARVTLTEYTGRTRTKGLVVLGDRGTRELRIARLQEPAEAAREDNFADQLAVPFGEEPQDDETTADEALSLPEDDDGLGDQPATDTDAEEGPDDQPAARAREFREIEPAQDEDNDPYEVPRFEDREPPAPDDEELEFPEEQEMDIESVLQLPGRDDEGGTRLPPVDIEGFDDSLFEEYDAERERKETEKLCAEEMRALKASRIADVNLDISLRGTAGRDFPFECSLDTGEEFAPRSWSRVTYMWKASNLHHNPLYFEEVALERYGHTWGPCLQPFASGAHFFTRLPVLPYCMGYTPPCECQYVLGYYRPGNCAPYMCPAVPISLRGGLMQAGASVGAAAIIP